MAARNQRRSGTAPDVRWSAWSVWGRGRGVAWFAVVIVAACGPSGAATTPCEDLDPAMAEASFVLLTDPQEGARLESPLRIRGCSRTFESNVLWELQGRDGRILASGHATGGGVDGAGPFETAAPFDVSTVEVGRLRVFEADMSDGEGFPPSETVIPLILAPGGEARD